MDPIQTFANVLVGFGVWWACGHLALLMAAELKYKHGFAVPGVYNEWTYDYPGWIMCGPASIVFVVIVCITFRLIQVTKYPVHIVSDLMLDWEAVRYKAKIRKEELRLKQRKEWD